MTTNRRPMGFCAVHNPVIVRADGHPSGNDLLRFDSGRRLTFAQALRNILILGQTGSGKTTSVVLPSVRSLLAAGFGGLILDVKGSLRPHVRAIARACGREGDIVEFGSDPSANRTNLFAGLAVHEWVALLETMTMDGLEIDPNAFWSAKGAKMAGEVGRILYGLSRIARRSEFSRMLRPTLRLIHACLTDRRLAAGLLLFAKAEFDDLLKGRDIDSMSAYMVQAERLFGEIEADRFHIMKRRGKKFTDEDEKQQVWVLQRILYRLSQLQATHGLLDRFSCTDRDAVPMDFGRLVYGDNKVVLVHFGMDCGPAGDLLARTIKGMYYQSVMKHGLDLPDDRCMFMIADEFQHLLNVDRESRLNDMDFFGLSREFRNVNVIASQSVASLHAKGERDAVDSLLANCTTKVFMKSSDPRTIDWVRGFREEDAGDMKNLRRGECLLETMDENDDTVSCKDGLNGAYAFAQEGVVPEPERPSVSAEGHFGTPSGLPPAMERKLRELGTVTDEAEKAFPSPRRGAPLRDEERRSA
ncbi:MAG: type IV secretory system conjugative DNA transfer family protein, partial [Desulfovibrio sp.]|nr:type IV secretory system conjugative DNA transfer family protein [Desulfovibrio sp.]